MYGNSLHMLKADKNTFRMLAQAVGVSVQTSYSVIQFNIEFVELILS